MIKNEMLVVEDSFKEQSLLHKHIQEIVTTQSDAVPSQFQLGCVNLLNKRLLLCEASLLNLSKTVSLYHDVQLPTMYLLGSNDSLHLAIGDNEEDFSILLIFV